MKRILSFAYSFLISVLITSMAFGGGIPGQLTGPPRPLEDQSLIFRYDPSRNTTNDTVSKTAFSQTYSGTNRTYIDAFGNLRTAPANQPVIDYVSGVPMLRVEGEKANILLGSPPTTQDLTLPTGSYALQVSGAGTATSSAGTATITGAGAASNGTPNVFVVTVAGTVTITIDTATVVWLTPGAIPGSYFAGAAAIGDELVTDGGFDAVTATNSYTSDFSAGVDGWSGGAGAAAGNIDAIGGENDWLKLTVDGTNAAHPLIKATTFTIGNCYRVRFKYYIPSGQSNIDGIRLMYGNGLAAYSTIYNTLDAVTSFDFYVNSAEASGIRINPTDGGSTNFQDAGADDVFYIKDVIIDAITFTSWTAGAGWAPQATAGVLTGKAQKIAGTASALSQPGAAATAGKVNRISHVVTRTAGSETPEFGSTNGAAISASGTYYAYVISADTDYLKFNADSSFAGTIDSVSVKEHGTVRASEAGTITATTSAKMLAALAAVGTMAIKIRFPYAKTQVTAATNIFTPSNSATGFLYHTSAGVFTLSDGTATATNDDAFIANTDYYIVPRWGKTGAKMDLGFGVPGSISFDAEANFDGAMTTTGNLEYLFHTIGQGGGYIQKILAWDEMKEATYLNALR